jgi:hypothetical protein
LQADIEDVPRLQDLDDFRAGDFVRALLGDPPS